MSRGRHDLLGPLRVASPRQDLGVPGCGEQRAGHLTGEGPPNVSILQMEKLTWPWCPQLHPYNVPPSQLPAPSIGSQPQLCHLSSRDHEY